MDEDVTTTTAFLSVPSTDVDSGALCCTDAESSSIQSLASFTGGSGGLEPKGERWR